MSRVEAYEETIKKFNLDPEAQYKNADNEIPLPIEWRAEIIKFHIDQVLTDVEYVNHDQVNRLYVVVFKNKEVLEKNEVKFHAKFINSLNTYIKEIKKDNPKKYYRGAILETAADGISFSIKY